MVTRWQITAIWQQFDVHVKVVPIVGSCLIFVNFVTPTHYLAQGLQKYTKKF